MPVVTSIKPQKNKKGVNIYLDGEFGFGLDLETYVKSGIKVEQELGKSEIEKIVRKGNFQKNYEKLVKYATMRPRSEYEIKGWFRRHKVYDGLHEKLLEKLHKLDLLDDEKFARWWVDQRNRFRPRSKRVLYQELRKKGIDKDLIKHTLENIDVDEGQIVKELLKKNMRKWKGLGKYEARQKASAYLARKGFSWDVVKEALEILDD